MKRRFDQAGIRVVRMGLQAGPWHPAFGELLAKVSSSEETIHLSINERDQSVFRGMKSANVKRLQQLGLWQRIVLSTDPTLRRGTVMILS